MKTRYRITVTAVLPFVVLDLPFFTSMPGIYSLYVYTLAMHEGISIPFAGVEK